jgi:hypothetical protein
MWRKRAIVLCFGAWDERAAEETSKRNIMQANTLSDEIVFVKKRNDKLQRSVMKMEEQRCRLGAALAFKLLHPTTHKIFASWSIMARGSNNLKTINIHTHQILLLSLFLIYEAHLILFSFRRHRHAYPFNCRARHGKRWLFGGKRH